MRNPLTSALQYLTLKEYYVTHFSYASDVKLGVKKKIPCKMKTESPPSLLSTAEDFCQAHPIKENVHISSLSIDGSM